MTPDVIEKLMVLMKEHEFDELEFQGLVLKKSRHKSPAYVAATDERVALAKHLAPLPDEPWNAVPQHAVDAWAEKGSP